LEVHVMAKGNLIVVRSDPLGRFEEGVISGTPKPGTCMQVKAATAEALGVRTFEAVTRATGAKGPICVLMPDYLRGRLGVGAAQAFGPPAAGDAYADGDRGFLYWPEPGDTLNMIVASVAGTADDVAIGALFGVEQNTGKLKADSSYDSAPFQALEAVTDPTADYMLHVLYLGNQA
jgi:hypothetical protein